MVHSPPAPSEFEADQIQQLSRILQLPSPALVTTDGHRLELPDVVLALLKEIAHSLQAGRGVVLVPDSQRLTTQRAADLLGISRPFLTSEDRRASGSQA